MSHDVRPPHDDQVHIGPGLNTRLHLRAHADGTTLTIEQDGVCIQIPVEAADLAYAERLIQKARARLDGTS